MGIRDKFGDMADDAMDRAGGPEKSKEHIGKAADAANNATGRRFEDKVDKGESGAKSAVDKLARKRQQEQQHQQGQHRQQPPSR